MCKVTKLRELVKRKLDVAVEEIFALFEATIADYEEQFRRNKETSKQRLLEQIQAVIKPRVRPRRGVRVRHAGKDREDEVSSEEQEEPPAKRKKKAAGRTGLRSSQRKKTKAGGGCREDLQSTPDYLAPISDMDDMNSDGDSDYRDNAKEPLKINQKLKCSECGDLFAHKKDLDRHAKTHTGEKPLNSAVVRKPSNTVKSFTCSVCTKSFPSRDILIAHIKAHTQEKQSAAGSSSQQVTTQAGKHSKDLDSQPDLLAPVSDMDDITADSSDSDHGGNGEEPLETKKKLKCSECDEMFVHKGDLDRHATTHAGKKPLNSAGAPKPSVTVKTFDCSVCKKSFTSRGILISHIREHTEEKPVASTSQNVVTEGKHLHSQPGKLAPATKPSVTVKMFNCSVCKKIFTSRDILKSHMREHTEEKPKPVASTSQNVVTEGKNLHSQPDKSSAVTKSTSTIKYLTCSVCPKTFTSSDFLTSHMRQVHTEEKPVASTSQNVVTEGKNLPSQPEKSSAATKPSSAVKTVCSVCKKCFSSSDFLTSHMRVHTEEKPKPVASTSQNVVTEGKNLPSQPDKSSAATKPSDTAKTFDCSVFKKIFTSRDILTSHMRVHTEEKPKPKPVASTSQNVVTEGKNLPSQPDKSSAATKPSDTAKTFDCSVCKKIFTSRDILTSHMRVHTEAKPKPVVASTSQNVVTEGKNLPSQPDKSSAATKPSVTVKMFDCSLCKKSFASHDFLTSHMRQAHPQEKPVASTSSSPNVDVTNGENLHSQQGKSSPATQPSSAVKTCAGSFFKKSLASGDCLTSHMRVHAQEKPVASTSQQAVTEVKNLPSQSDKDDVTSDSSDTETEDNAKYASETNNKFKCSECSEVFVHQEDLDGHLGTHIGKKPPNSVGVTELFYTVNSFICAICMKIFMSNDALVTHMSIHTGKQESPSASSSKPVTVEVNGKHDLLSEPESLFAPLSYSDMTESSGDDPDGKSSVSLATTNTFEGEAHRNDESKERVKPFACSVCDKSYSKKGTFMRHVRVHGEEKSKAGEGSQACNKAADRLKTKKSKRHVKHLKCGHCQKGFGRISHLTKHLEEAHSLEKPFACQFCDEKFSFPEAMRMHVQDQHSQGAC
ncbi:uncharacterized protein LOC144062949 [Vanacampus margaritifer]